MTHTLLREENTKYTHHDQLAKELIHNFFGRWESLKAFPVCISATKASTQKLGGRLVF